MSFLFPDRSFELVERLLQLEACEAGVGWRGDQRREAVAFNRVTCERFESFVDRGIGPSCHFWIGMRIPSGYGILWEKRFFVYAHRFAWERVHGRIQDPELQVCHVCDVPPCVRDDHLFLGTVKDNVHDSILKGRRRARPELFAEILAERSAA